MMGVLAIGEAQQEPGDGCMTREWRLIKRRSDWRFFYEGTCHKGAVRERAGDVIKPGCWRPWRIRATAP